jgi:hypothetical protein
MSTDTSQRGHVRVITGYGDLPVEIRDRRMRLVDRGLSRWMWDPDLYYALSGREFHLDPGAYMVSIRLPGGRQLAEAIEVDAGSDQLVDLTPEVESLGPRARYTNPVPAAEPSSAEPEDRPPDFAIRFFHLEGLSGAWPATVSAPSRDPLRLALGWRDFQSSSFGFEVVVPWGRVVFAQLARSAEIPLNVALLPGSISSRFCYLTVEEQAGSLNAGVVPSDGTALQAAQHLAAGEEEHAALLISGRAAEYLLEGKFLNPIGAVLGGYVLLRLNELERTHDWTDNLANRFMWLPDGAVIAGEKAAMLGDHLRALDRFLEAGYRGLPLFTDGYSILVSRLRQYQSNAHIHAQLTEEQAADIRTLSARLEEWSPFVDFSALTLTFRAAVLTQPTESQHPVEISEEIFSWP